MSESQHVSDPSKLNRKLFAFARSHYDPHMIRPFCKRKGCDPRNTPAAGLLAGRQRILALGPWTTNSVTGGLTSLHLKFWRS